MRTYDVTEEYDRKELARLEPQPWMAELLAMNPDYPHWGPGDDYMRGPKQEGGWDAGLVFTSWREFGPWTLDDYNEVVHFYFSIVRPNQDCPTCGGNGTHPDAQWISESFYSHSSPFTHPTEDEEYGKARLSQFGCRFPSLLGRGRIPPDELLERYGKPFLDCCVRIMEHGGYWHDDITEDEAGTLVAEGRGSMERLTTAEDFNRANAPGVRGWGHDAINRWILVNQRCKRLGIPTQCPTCEGHGHLFIGPARVDLTLWVLHPRKGCSRGVEVQDIQQDELPAVFAFLREAARRNAERFGKIPS